MSRPDDQLATLVRDAAPRPSEEFLARLDARVDERFGKPERRRRTWSDRAKWRLAGGLAAACAAGVIVVVATSGGSSEHVEGFSATGGSEATQSAPARTGAAQSAAPNASAAAPAAGTVAPSSPPRRVIQDTQLALTTAPKDFATTTDGVVAASDRFGGIVQSSNIDQSGATGHASFDLRIPASRLDEAMAALSRLAHVRSRSAASQDVTAQYLSATERLDEARAERRGILRALAGATTANQTRVLRLRLREVDARLGRARADVRSLKQRTDYVRVQVTVDAAKRGEAVPGTGGDHRWTPGDALRDAGHILQTVAGIALLVLAIGLPLALLGGLASAGGRAVRRRRREAALG